MTGSSHITAEMRSTGRASVGTVGHRHGLTVARTGLCLDGGHPRTGKASEGSAESAGEKRRVPTCGRKKSPAPSAGAGPDSFYRIDTGSDGVGSPRWCVFDRALERENE